MLESGIGRAHNIALSTLENFSLPGDVTASRRYWVEDVIDPEVVVTPQGTIQVPDGPGIGYTPRLDRIEIDCRPKRSPDVAPRAPSAVCRAAHFRPNPNHQCRPQKKSSYMRPPGHSPLIGHPQRAHAAEKLHEKPVTQHQKRRNPYREKQKQCRESGWSPAPVETKR